MPGFGMVNIPIQSSRKDGGEGRGDGGGGGGSGGGGGGRR